MTEITDGSGVTYPAEAYQAVFMDARRLRARLTESEAEIERLRTRVEELDAGWEDDHKRHKKADAENERLRGTCEWQADNDRKNAETISRLLAELRQLRAEHARLTADYERLQGTFKTFATYLNDYLAECGDDERAMPDVLRQLGAAVRNPADQC